MHVAVIVSAGQGGSVSVAGPLRCATSVVVVQRDDHQTLALAKADVAVLTCALSATSPVAAAVHTFAERGSPVLGLGDGFAGLCSAGLLPGRFAASQGSETFPLSGYFRTEGRLTPFTAGIPAGRVLPVNWHAPHTYSCASVIDIERGGQIIFRHCDAWAGVSAKHNPFASTCAIAGLCSPRGNVLGVGAWLDLQAAPLLDQMFASVKLWIAQGS